MADGVSDVVVIGLGGVGSAAVYHFAKRGISVIGIDQASPPHDRGSSHGQTRVIRQAYFEHSSYVPLLTEAYRLWEQLESECGQKLFHRTGLIEIGPSDGVVIPGVTRSAQEHGLPFDTMSMQEACKRFPGIAGDESWQVVFEQNAGYLQVEGCVAAHLQQAALLGANLVTNQTVTRWQATESGVIVCTPQQTYHAKKLVIAGGPWSADVIAQLAHQPQNIHREDCGDSAGSLTTLQVQRKHMYWYEAPATTYGEDHGFPCFFFETPTGYFYGTPSRDQRGIKVARHSGGQVVDSMSGDRHQRDPEDQTLVESFLRQCLPQVRSKLLNWCGCYYTMTKDEHFIIDHLSTSRQVTVIAGLSGHGFKFTSVLGSIAAELATESQVDWDLSLFRLNR